MVRSGPIKSTSLKADRPRLLSPGVVQGAGVLRETCVVRIASEGFLDTRSASFAPAAGLSRTSRSNSNHLP
jgi:hypothetical protein